MIIEFVNHASFLVEHGDLRLLCDPWIEGRVFDRGWDLLAPTAFTYDDFRRVTHLWFSHEHPDHFYPPNLECVPPAVRERIEVLFQRTLDRRVVGYCERAGFGRVRELEPGEWTRVADDAAVLNRPLGTEWAGDSWLMLVTPGVRLLNLNDCGVRAQEARAIRDEVGAVDVLATQFSYAAWQGNVEAVERRRENAAAVLRRVLEQIEILRPRYVIPFASFVWFCAEDNGYLNADMNRIRDVHDAIRERTDAEPIVLYPGDRWRVGDPHDSLAAIARYEADAARVSDPAATPRTPPVSVEPAELQAAARGFAADLDERSSAALVRMYLAYDRYRNHLGTGRGHIACLLGLARAAVDPVHFWVEDHGAAYRFDLRGGLRPSARRRDDCDMRLASSSLHFCFRNPFGGETLQINGRFQENDRWPDVPPWTYPNRLFLYTRLARRIEMGYELRWGRALRAIGRRVGARLAPISRATSRPPPPGAVDAGGRFDAGGVSGRDG